ncbi:MULTISPECIES: fimbria/pilus periplasmic chaperone [unclassified Caballeronia]|uniref:fimbrial biogenesis chaperone n=1 Tax=unclassified Caballeronia TaxID=2646786 RepID=UPI0020293830|nr:MULTISPECIES: fimbria/pilus periplasmic chaperone [unclassified Caballeronia]
MQRLASFLLAAWIVYTPLAFASSLQVSPTIVELQASERAQGLWLRNSGNTPIHAQIRVSRWSQDNSQDILDPTRDIVASPPILSIEPHAEQLVRIVLLQPPLEGEQAYRMIIDELPDALPSGASASPGLNFLLRYSVPVFVNAAQSATKTENNPDSAASLTDLRSIQATLKADPIAKHTATLVVLNTGTRRIKISELAFVDAQGVRTPLAKGLLGYVLAQRQMAWTLHGLPVPAAMRNGKIEGKFNDDPQPQALPVMVNFP